MRRLLLAAAALLAVAAPGAWAGTNVLTVSAVVLSRNSCRFTAPSSVLGVAIDPASPGPASGSVSLSFRCTGSSATAAWSLSNGSGLYGSGPTSLRMRHATVVSEFLPYSLAYPASGSTPKNATQTITVTATVAAADFQNALPGAYSDTVTFSLLP